MLKNYICMTCLLLSIGFSVTVYAKDDPWRVKPEAVPWLDERNFEVPSQLIIPVTESKINQAVKMLENKQIIRIDLHTAAKLAGSTIDPNRQLKEAYDEAEQYAKKKEKKAKGPLFSSSEASRTLEEAHDSRKKALKTKAMKGKIKPFLIRAVSLNEGTGRFMAYVINNQLWIYHESLGRYYEPQQKHPVIVFLEKIPTVLYVDVSVAR